MTDAPGIEKVKPTPMRSPVWRFIAMLAVWLALFYAVTATPWFRQHVFPAYLSLNASTAAAMLNLLGERVTATGSTIVSSQHALSILRGCDAIEPTALFVAAALAFPVSWRKRGLAVLIGVPVLAALNLVRIISLYYAKALAPELFEVIHVDVWQSAFVLAVMLLWMVWAWRAAAPPKKLPDAPAKKQPDAPR